MIHEANVIAIRRTYATSGRDAVLVAGLALALIAILGPVVVRCPEAAS